MWGFHKLIHMKRPQPDGLLTTVTRNLPRYNLLLIFNTTKSKDNKNNAEPLAHTASAPFTQDLFRGLRPQPTGGWGGAPQCTGVIHTDSFLGSSLVSPTDSAAPAWDPTEHCHFSPQMSPRSRLVLQKELAREASQTDLKLSCHCNLKRSRLVNNNKHCPVSPEKTPRPDLGNKCINTNKNNLQQW
jgi:hypothetical protein